MAAGFTQSGSGSNSGSNKGDNSGGKGANSNPNSGGQLQRNGRSSGGAARSARSVALKPVTLPRRGRKGNDGGTVTAKMLGTAHVLHSKRGAQVRIDLSSMAEVPLIDLAKLAESEGINASMALARGINAFQVERASRGVEAQLRDHLLDSGQVADAAMAARVARHALRLGQTYHVDTEKALAMVLELQGAGAQAPDDSTDNEGDAASPE